MPSSCFLWSNAFSETCVPSFNFTIKCLHAHNGAWGPVVLRGENSLFYRPKVGIFDHQIFTPLKNKHKIARAPLSPKGMRQKKLPSEYFPLLPSVIQTRQHLRALAPALKCRT
jgi:hypothetical protein